MKRFFYDKKIKKLSLIHELIQLYNILVELSQKVIFWRCFRFILRSSTSYESYHYLHCNCYQSSIVSHQKILFFRKTGSSAPQKKRICCGTSWTTISNLPTAFGSCSLFIKDFSPVRLELAHYWHTADSFSKALVQHAYVLGFADSASTGWSWQNWCYPGFATALHL